MTDPRRQATPMQAQPVAAGAPPAAPPAAPPPDKAGPSGPHLGPIPITATGVLIVVALVGSLLYLGYAFTVRDASQIPLLASGAVVLGIVFGAIAIVGARATWRSSVQGRDARAFGHAIIGGLAALAAAAAFAAAIILFLLRQTPAV